MYLLIIFKHFNFNNILWYHKSSFNKFLFVNWISKKYWFLFIFLDKEDKEISEGFEDNEDNKGSEDKDIEEGSEDNEEDNEDE